ncbi:von Willebrand factor A domain-containing protein DDB_G0286969-like [Pararge aegeria]|nr:von Willebrand factor A domain-containing protein DDB_G0286969-like [Pararge aegeria]
MKVLLLCMAFAAMSLAMPVAEEKSDVPLAPPSIPEIKPEEAKVQSELKAISVEEKKPETETETKTAEILPEAAAKSAVAPVDIAPDTQSATKAEITPEVKKEEIPEAKAAVPEASLPEEVKPTETKPEIKSGLIEPKPVLEESKPEETQAKVEEVANEQPLAKSAIPEDVIDLVSVVKNNAAVADDVVDAAAINPAIATKSALPEEEKIAESPAPVSEVKAIQPEESKPLEPKTEEKPAEIAPASDASTSAKSVASDTRVVRDAAEEKEESKESKVESKTIAEAIKDEVKPVDIAKIESKSTKPEEVQIAKDKESESVQTEVSNETAAKSGEAIIEKGKEAAAAIKPAEIIPAKPAEKPQDQILNDQPAKEEAKTSSEESRETAEKPEKDSSEESGESSESKP